MLLQLLFSSPLVAVAWIMAIIFALTVHEFAHALIGKWRGDDTAEQMGRLTLNPLAHLDPMGTIMLLVVGMGWAKPVPFDPRNLKNPAWDGTVIAFAGPFANLFLAVVAAACYRSVAVAGLAQDSLLPLFLILLIFTNLTLLFFNLLPIPPLDGSKAIDAALYSAGLERVRIWLAVYGPKILLGLVILSLVVPGLNIFFFIQIPAFFACDQMIAQSCLGTLSTYLGG